jgi:hypothetical protein
LNGYKIDRMLKDKNTNNDMATQNSRRYFRGHLGYQSKREV